MPPPRRSAQETPGPETVARRWALLRDLIVFVAKASLEALRDIALIPAALVAGLAGLLISPSQPDRYFQEILKIGDRFDDFVDLFGKEARKRRRPGLLGRRSKDLRADDVFDRIERVLVDEYRRGGLTAQAKQAIDRGLDSVQEALGSTAVPDPAPPEADPPRR